MSTRRTVVRPSTSQRATSSTKRRQDENQLADQPAAAAPMPTGRLSRAPLKASLLNQNNPRSTEVVVPSKRPAKGPPKDEEEGGFNIQVAVRLRSRSTREVEERSPIIFTTTGALGSEVREESASASAAAAHPRTFAFDKVFGPEASQELIYSEVIVEVLDEVLAGFSCTVLAYGQTGTGKTHTMIGDLALTPLGRPVSNAGIVPRVLHALFGALKDQDAVIKVSFMEIYNEEIRDLLVPPSDPKEELKVFSDQTKGAWVRGLEEVGVSTLQDGLRLLVEGTARRQVAQTLMNAQSSRSHSIFSIRVHHRGSVNSTGAEILRTGRLNLVDLAGSESVGRSGAVGERAAEAGNINQSLLTLGRVVESLVQKSSHIPYRDSNLTRILQDSLGGRTKTRMIATISPTRSNADETVSTLHYASRTTQVVNRPKENAKVSKDTLLGALVAENEGLRRHLIASREKNGCFVPRDEWDAQQAEQELQRTQLAETLSLAQQTGAELGQLRVEHDDLAREYLRAEQRRVELESQVLALGGQLDQARMAHETLVADLAALERAREALVGQLEELGREKIALEAEREELGRELVESGEREQATARRLDESERQVVVLTTETQRLTTALAQGSALAGSSADLVAHLSATFDAFAASSGTVLASLRANALENQRESLRAIGQDQTLE